MLNLQNRQLMNDLRKINPVQAERLLRTFQAECASKRYRMDVLQMRTHGRLGDALRKEKQGSN